MPGVVVAFVTKNWVRFGILSLVGCFEMLNLGKKDEKEKSGLGELVFWIVGIRNELGLGAKFVTVVAIEEVNWGKDLERTYIGEKRF